MNKKIQLIPVMLCFFAMGFVDLVGIASNYVQADLQLSDSAANIFPSLVFFWFLIFSVPTGILMNRIGRKLASTMTFGQFVKAIASFMAPYIAMWGATAAMPSFGLGWRVLFPVYGAIGILAALLLALSPIEREQVADKASGFVECFKLLGKPIVLLSFLGIMCHVGIDVGTNTTAPKLLMERVGMSLTEAGFATSLYFIFRTIGCLSGSFILSKFSHRKFFLVSVVLMALSMCGMFVGHSKEILYAAIALVGFGNSNIFSIVFSQALLAVPQKQNEVSGLMIMGLFGGTVFPLLMGFASDAVGQAGAVAVMTVGVAYLFYYFTKVRK